MEKVIHTPDKFRLPHYESVCWYAGVRLVVELRDMAAAGTRVPPIMIAGARALLATLRQWGGEVKSLLCCISICITGEEIANILVLLLVLYDFILQKE